MYYSTPDVATSALSLAERAYGLPSGVLYHLVLSVSRPHFVFLKQPHVKTGLLYEELDGSPSSQYQR